jgi:hypothetical protein
MACNFITEYSSIKRRREQRACRDWSKRVLNYILVKIVRLVYVIYISYSAVSKLSHNITFAFLLLPIRDIPGSNTGPGDRLPLLRFFAIFLSPSWRIPE